MMPEVRKWCICKDWKQEGAARCVERRDAYSLCSWIKIWVGGKEQEISMGGTVVREEDGWMSGLLGGVDLYDVATQRGMVWEKAKVLEAQESEALRNPTG
jgi:hypothetical protein